MYAFDLLGFGQSSRPKFAKTAEDAEEELVESIEQWRDVLCIDTMVLLGHSFGGYLVSCYALKYHHRYGYYINSRDVFAATGVGEGVNLRAGEGSDPKK